MKRTIVATALALALVASTIAVAGGTTPAASFETDEHPSERVTTLDPSAVLAAIEAGEPFELPTVHGEATILAGDRVQETISYTDVTLDGERVTTVRPPNVWWIERTDASGLGAVLAFNHTVHAWLRDGDGTTLLAPVDDRPDVPWPFLDYRVYEVPDLLGSSQPDGDGEDGGVGILSHIKVFKDVYAYVDTEYRDWRGSCCWADYVDYTLGLLNGYFDDVELEYSYHGGEVDSGFNSNSMDDAWNRLTGLSWNGADVRSHFSYKDFDGCEVGTAAFPGASFLIQHKADACHLGLVPSSDGERAYLTAHELGKNNYAHPNYHWSDTTLTGHEHRSIMDPSLGGHYHGCWSQTNMDRMSSYLGTSSVGTAC